MILLMWKKYIKKADGISSEYEKGWFCKYTKERIWK